ncbi:MAG: nucleotide sugar dehydrogenase, partial [Cytophagaceae bacterium]|nr:nucleotide sugar dehydrogenase [Cytophagaceae bacterium]
MTKKVIYQINNPLPNSIRIGILGLGYIGLPLAVAFAERYPVVGYDHNPTRIAELQRGQDRTREVDQEALQAVAETLTLTANPAALADCTVFILTVPTPVDAAKRPDLGPLLSASATVGQLLKRGDIVIYESTVYPGCTEEDCVPVLERESTLRFNEDFTVGYSPERLSPGDRTRRLTDIVKITSGSTPDAADFVDSLYRSIVRAGTYRAPSIRVAEAAKVVENAQRDVNISFVNELALLFDRLGLDTHEVLAAAATKWNFLPFQPGLGGGHCISVDPYYLIHKAEEVGYSPQVIASG